MKRREDIARTFGGGGGEGSTSEDGGRLVDMIGERKK